MDDGDCSSNKRYAEGIDKLLNSPVGRKRFTRYLADTDYTTALQLWEMCDDLSKRTFRGKVDVERIVNFADDNDVNVPIDVMRRARDALDQGVPDVEFVVAMLREAAEKDLNVIYKQFRQDKLV